MAIRATLQESGRAAGLRHSFAGPYRPGLEITTALDLSISRMHMTTVVILGWGMKKVQLRDAKAKLSAIIDDAVRGKPSVITRHGKREAVVISYEEWNRLSHIPSFAKYLMSIPSEIPDSRDRTPLRDAEF
jgi:antitoxin Phd